MPQVLLKIKNNWTALLAAVFAVLFFIGTSSFNYYTQHYIDQDGKKREFVRWASPDESANYVFTKLYAQERLLSIAENYNLSAKDIMHPRSIRSDNGVLRPMSFLGIILIYGNIAKIFGYKVIPYLTPFFASLGIYYFYLLIRSIFGRGNAWLSAGMLAVFPPYIFYSARSMFHNVLFTVLVIIGLYYAIRSVAEKKREENSGQGEKGMLNVFQSKRFFLKIFFCGRFFAFVSGAFFGLAAITRTSELLWLLPLLFFLWIFNLRKFGILRLIFFLFGFSLALLPALYYNNILYGSYFYTGYSEMNSSLASIAKAGSDLAKSTADRDFSAYISILDRIKNLIFHFGLHPRQSFDMAIIYFAKMFYWLFAPFFLGGIAFIVDYKKHKPGQRLFLFLLVALSAILIVYYGSWVFNDNPDKSRHTIGNSYTRYWLPVYLGAMPFAAIFLQNLVRAVFGFINGIVFGPWRRKNGQPSLFGRMPERIFGFVLNLVVLSVFSYLSLTYVLYGSEEGLIQLAKRQIKSREEFGAVMGLTEGNSAIITFYHDKLFFPERKVIVGLFNDQNMNREYAKLAGLLPLYYYNFTLPQKDLDYLNSKRLAEIGLSINTVKRINDDFTLYRLTLK